MQSGGHATKHLLDDALDGAMRLTDRLAVGDDDALQCRGAQCHFNMQLG